MSAIAMLALVLLLLSMGVTEEVALGGLGGRVTMAENGLPIKRAFVTLIPAFTLDEGGGRSRTVETDERGEFRVSNLPVGPYIIEASAKAHSLIPTHVAITEGPPTDLELALAPEEPRLRLYNSQRVFMPTDSPEIEAHGFGPDASLALSIYKVDVATIAKEGSIRDLMYSLGEYSRQSKRPEEVGTLVLKEEHRIENLDGEGTFIDAIKVRPLPEGFYLLKTTYGKLTKATFLNVSSIALVTKSVQGESLCFVTDLKTGEPIAGAILSALQDESLVAVGRTNAQGIATVATPDKSGEAMVVATHGDSTAASSFYAYGGDSDSPHTVFGYTERPIYRPGDEVSFKGFVRKRSGADYVLPGTGLAQCSVRDEDGSEIDSFEVAVRQNGSFNGRFSTNKEAAPGLYQLAVRAFGREHTINVPLAAYRKPEFTVAVEWSKPFYAMGERAKATVRCTYYFGGPVVGAKVTANVYRNPTWVQPPGDDSEADEYEGGYSESYEGGFGLEDLEATTNERGEAVFEFKTQHKSDKQPFQNDFTYTLYASVAEAGDKFFSGEGNVLVARGGFGLAVQTDRYVLSPGDPLTATIQTFSHVNGAPVAGRRIRLVIGTERWTQNESVFTAKRELSATTDDYGKAVIQVPTNDAEGSFVIKAIAEDDQDRRIEEQTWLWVEGGSVQPQPQGKLTLTMDKRQYKPGETAKALIAVESPGGSALVTIESERVLKSWVVPLASQTTTISIPVQSAYLPRVTVAVAMVKDKKFFEASQPLKMDLSVRKLVVSVQGDRTRYLPGDSATFTVKTTEADGKPAPSEVSLAVVDESIYAIHEDDTDPVAAFYPRRQNMVQTSYSFPELYLDGGDKGGAIPIRMNFKDTAAWHPTVRTDANGLATVKVTLPDNLTEWRATAVGVSDSTHVGMGAGQAVASKPLMVRLQGPAFMVAGDRQTISAIVNNDTEEAQRVTVQVAATGLRTNDSATQTLRVPKGGSATAEWDFEAAVTGVGILKATARAARGATDGVEQRIPILAHGRSVSSYSAGETDGKSGFEVTLRGDADPNAGRLELTLSPSIAATLYQSLDELIGYPYGCTEQTMSRFLPTIALAGVPSVRRALTPEFRSEIPKMVADGVARLDRMQQYDGGWGWWEHGGSDSFMTAYVLDGLLLAKSLGYAVDEGVLTSGLERAEKMLVEVKSKPIAPKDQLYLAWVLARGGLKDPGKKLANEMPLGSASGATLAIAILLFDSIADEVRMNAALEALTAAALESQALAHWPEEPHVWGHESTAFALRAIQQVSPSDPLLAKTIRYLLQNRRGEWWSSTRDTSFAVIAISAHLRATEQPGEGKPFRVVAKINGREVAAVSLDPVRPLDPKYRVTIPVKSLASGANEVELIAQGGESVFYTAELQQVAVAPRLGKLVTGPGFTLDRQYYLLRPSRQEDGSLRLLPSKEPVSRARSGDLVRCVLTIQSDREREFVMLEDPVPSNCRIMEREAPGLDEEWTWWWSNTVIRDDRIAFFARSLPKGKSEISFTMRAESPGRSWALPPVVENMYDPTQRASDGECLLEVRP